MGLLEQKYTGELSMKNRFLNVGAVALMASSMLWAQSSTTQDATQSGKSVMAVPQTEGNTNVQQAPCGNPSADLKSERPGAMSANQEMRSSQADLNMGKKGKTPDTSSDVEAERSEAGRR